MKDNTFAGRDLLNSSAIGGAGATMIKTSRAAHVQKPPATTVSGEGSAHLTPDEAAFVEALVDHMLRVDAVARDVTQIGRALYIDSTLADNRGSRHHPWAALYRVGMAAVNLYCKRAFGTLFDQIPDRKRKGVLRLLDSIKFVFEDGSDAGVFFAIVCHTMLEARILDAARSGSGLRAP